MIYREFGRTGFNASVVGMGTYYDFPWILSAAMFGKRLNEPGILESLRLGLDRGINLIDTAEIYRSEPLIAKALEGRDRESVFIASKAFPTHYRKEKLIRACEKSLRLLGTKYLDLYQLHFPSLRVPLAEVMHTLEELVDRGLVRHIGISNFSFDSMLEAEKALRKYPLTSVQLHYNISNRRVEEKILPYCQKNGIAVLAYYPVGHGKLAAGGKGFEEVFRKVAASHGLRTNAQVALAYLTSSGSCVFPIPRARTPAHVEENAELDGAVLTEEEMELLRSSFPSGGLTKSQ